MAANWRRAPMLMARQQQQQQDALNIDAVRRGV